VELKFVAFLLSALGGRLSGNFHAPVTLPLVTTGGWMGPKSLFEHVGEDKICVTPRYRSPDLPSMTNLFTDLSS
jgi:hypothetical protein